MPGRYPRPSSTRAGMRPRGTKRSRCRRRACSRRSRWRGKGRGEDEISSWSPRFARYPVTGSLDYGGSEGHCGGAGQEGLSCPGSIVWLRGGCAGGAMTAFSHSRVAPRLPKESDSGPHQSPSSMWSILDPSSCATEVGALAFDRGWRETGSRVVGEAWCRQRSGRAVSWSSSRPMRSSSRSRIVSSSRSTVTQTRSQSRRAVIDLPMRSSTRGRIASRTRFSSSPASGKSRSESCSRRGHRRSRRFSVF